MSALDEIIGRVKDTDRCLYERAMREIYEMRSGFHFDEPHARSMVSKMHSSDRGGNEHRGEHWSFDEVTNAMRQYIGMMSDSDTMWDAYVALNSWWHDLADNYARRTPDSEAWIVEDAVKWAFQDEDAPDGKVWRYMYAMD